MPVIVTTRIPSLPPEAYDATASQLAPALRGADGFIAHAASTDADGVTVTELWRSADDWRGFFGAYVEPNLPPDLPAPSVVELRNAIVR